MLLWRQIHVNTARCEHPCDSLQPFLILWMIILGSSACKDLETSSVRLFLKHAVTRLSSESMRSHSRCIGVFSDVCVQTGPVRAVGDGGLGAAAVASGSSRRSDASWEGSSRAAGVSPALHHALSGAQPAVPALLLPGALQVRRYGQQIYLQIARYL